MIHHADDHLSVHIGDCREVLAELPAESVHCVVTSPPYWGLRDYGTATWEGGEEGCDHAAPARQGRTGMLNDGMSRAQTEDGQVDFYRETCRKCGARRIDSQLGLEATPEEYVANMVSVFREVRRVLRSDGTVWLNIGDSYHHTSGGYNPDAPSNRPGYYDGDPRGNAGSRYEGDNERGLSGRKYPGPLPGLKPKDLVGIPWRLAFALQADGWYLRSDIIWSKPNPMPESVTDRPTKAHEYVFLLTKSPRYFYDADAVREGAATDSWPGIGPKHGTTDNHRSDYEPMAVNAGRNLRTVWTIATQPYPGAHFATFPEKLVEPCIKAGTSERGVCPECGAPWVREVLKVPNPSKLYNVGERLDGGAAKTANPQTSKGLHRNNGNAEGPPPVTTGWRPSCRHDAEPVPAAVLDPFGGSGTTARVANRLGRRAILIDLSADYIDQAMTRNAQAPLGLLG